MAPHSSTLAWKIPWTEEPGGLQSMGSLRVGCHWATSLSPFTFLHWRRKWQPLQCSCLENPRDGGAWWAAVYGVAQSRTRLKRLSSSSSSSSSGTVQTLQLTFQERALLMNRWTLNQKLLTPQPVMLCFISCLRVISIVILYLRVPNRIKTKRATAKHIVIKMTKLSIKKEY